jgi:hypothetical protein
MKLRFNPLHAFKASTTPAGLYARQKWLGESSTRIWKNDFHNTLLILMKDQKKDGSWNGSEIETITHLFGLHLTIRERSTEIEEAMNWLYRKIDLQSTYRKPSSDLEIIDEKLESLPFIWSRRDIFLMSTVFSQCLCSV